MGENVGLLAFGRMVYSWVGVEERVEEKESVGKASGGLWNFVCFRFPAGVVGNERSGETWLQGGFGGVFVGIFCPIFLWSMEEDGVCRSDESRGGL